MVLRPQSLSCDFHLSCYWKSFGNSNFGTVWLNYFFQAIYVSDVYCVSIWKGWVLLENMIYSSLWYLRVPWLIPAVFELWVMLLRQNHRTPSRNTCCFKRNSMAHFREETVLLYWFHVWCVRGSLKQNVQEHQLHFLTKRPHHLLIHSGLSIPMSDTYNKKNTHQNPLICGVRNA